MIGRQASRPILLAAGNSRTSSLAWLAMLITLQMLGLQLLAAQETEPAESLSFPRGEIVKSVPCVHKPEQSYALFLPTSYSPTRPAPIVYAFDPAARGSLPVELLKDAAEKHGYIVVGSNNSRNGPTEPQQAAANAVWYDTQQRFAIDNRRVYFTGFSGGARLATSLAIGCKCAAGVISHGAGFPNAHSPDSPIEFNYFAAVGNLDFNFPEVVDVATQLDASGSPNRLWQFQGTHQWAPPEIWEEALLWMELQGVKERQDSEDEQFVEQQLARATKRALELEEAGNMHAAAYEYRKLAQDFAGLADTSAFDRKAAQLATTKPFHQAQKQQEEEIDRQRRITGEFLYFLDVVRTDPGNRHEALFQLRRLTQQWKSRLEKQEDGEKTDVVLRRALHGVFALAYEAGLRALREDEPVVAAGHFEVAGKIASKSPMPLFHLARAHALNGDRKQALHALKKAVERGFKNPALLRETQEFIALQEKKEFRDILAQLEQSSPPPP